MRCAGDATRGRVGGVAEAFRESTGSGRVSLLAVCFVALARKEVLTTSVAKPNRTVDCDWKASSK